MILVNVKDAHPSSFRDPSGYIFVENDEVKRVINPIYFKQYEALTASGFFDNLIKNKLLISHKDPITIVYLCLAF